MMKFYFPFHLVTVSPWPLMLSFSLMLTMIGFIKFIIMKKIFLFTLSFILLIFLMIQWWRDVTRESTIQGFHSMKVLKGIQLGMLLFILFEIMFFLSFFWSYFHLILSPGVEIGMNFPLNNIILFNPFNVPLLNTIILLSSGVSITLTHFCILMSHKKMSLLNIFITIFLGGIFSIFQYLEYNESYFNITDSCYGSIFFLMTGFHGIHVIIGTLFILITYLRLYLNHCSFIHHFNFEGASWYWHFVDVIWLFLFLFIYWLIY
uniref:Cytochrome c oxidase subunit 3 n=1 Tax=Sigalphus bicolor TaxID=515846 RepID=A0A0A6ZL27_9HYME|nr:cytochrome c oxidase subunit III [Sigalphus bicolor]